MSEPAAVYFVRERNTTRLTGVMRNEYGEGILPDTIKLTLYEKVSGEVINSRALANIRNTGGGSCDASGNFAMVFDPEDNALVSGSPEPNQEKHIALIEWTWDTDKRADIEVEFRVRNTRFIPA